MSVLGELVEEREVVSAAPSSRWRIEVDFNCQRTPPSDVPVELRSILKQNGRCYRSRKVIVPEADRPEWCARRLGRHGFAIDPESLQLSRVAIADLGRRGGGIPYITVTATGTVVDTEAWNNALRDGIGAGRSFGLGLILATPIDSIPGKKGTDA